MKNVILWDEQATPTFLVRILRPREVKKPVQSHAAECHSPPCTLGCLKSEKEKGSILVVWESLLPVFSMELGAREGKLRGEPKKHFRRF